MKEDKAILSIGRFFESVFRFAESADDLDPTWGFSDSQGLAVAGSALKRVALSLLPKNLDADYKKAEHFAVRDVARAGHSKKELELAQSVTTTLILLLDATPTTWSAAYFCR
jgi:hypothetical protein